MRACSNPYCDHGQADQPDVCFMGNRKQCRVCDDRRPVTLADWLGALLIILTVSSPQAFKLKREETKTRRVRQEASRALFILGAPPASPPPRHAPRA